MCGIVFCWNVRVCRASLRGTGLPSECGALVNASGIQGVWRFGGTFHSVHGLGAMDATSGRCFHRVRINGRSRPRGCSSPVMHGLDDARRDGCSVMQSPWCVR